MGSLGTSHAWQAAGEQSGLMVTSVTRLVLQVRLRSILHHAASGECVLVRRCADALMLMAQTLNLGRSDLSAVR